MIRWNFCVLAPLLAFFAQFGLLGCSHETSREHIDNVRWSAHPHNAAIAMDSFWLDNRSPPDKQVEHFEFYYKHCVEDEFRRYPEHIEFMCTGPY